MGKGGEQSSDVANKPAQQADALLADPQFAPFLADDFSPAAFASHALADAQVTAMAQTARLQDGIRALNQKLRDEVIGRHSELLQQAYHLKDAEKAMQGINLSVDSLQSTLARVRDEVLEPYEAVRLKTQQLQNLHAAVDLLRAVIQRQKLTTRLRQQVATQSGASLDLAKAAKLLSDVLAVGSEVDLAGLEVVEADEEFLSSSGRQIRSQAEAALKAGMQSLSQAEVGSALQVYFNLQELREAVDGLIDQYTAQLEKAIQAALDPRKLSAGTASAGPGSTGGPGGARSAVAPGPGGAAKWQEALWVKLGAVGEAVHGVVAGIWHLQRVLAKKRDPLTHVCFMDVLLAGGDSLPLEKMWANVLRALTEGMATAANPAKGGFVRESLIASYPRLAALLEETFRKLLQDTSIRGTDAAVLPEQAEELLGAAAPFQHAYLGASLSRMSDAVAATFPGGTRALPTAAELQKCIGRMHEELRAVGESRRLAGLTAAGVTKALQLLAERAEYMAAAGPDLRAVGGACTSAQLRNMGLCSHLQEVHRSLLALLPRLPGTATDALRAPLDAIQSVAIEAVMPVFRAMVESCEQLVLGMHAADFGGAGGAEVTHASPYMAKLVRQIAHCRMEFLSKLQPAPSPAVPSFGGALVQRMASRLLLFFVRHASLLRPLSQAGKLQLAKDIAELEVAVGQNLYPLEHLGGPFRVLRAFRPLLFLETDALPASPLLGELPASVVLHHLYSRAPPQLASPHALHDFTPAQYSLWLDEHSMEEVVRFIRSALESCAPAAREQPGFDAVYPLMLRLCSAPQKQQQQQ